MGQAVVPASVLNITPGQSAPDKSLVLDPTGNNDLVTQFLLAHSLPKDIYAAALPLASGTATGGSTTTLVDSGKAWTTNAWAGYRVKITAGAAAGSYIVIASNTGYSGPKKLDHDIESNPW
jgi:hypothetical protein